MPRICELPFHRCNPIVETKPPLLADIFTVVVLGNTGAGKSTMLNSVLGEATLLPTNCMRACTATVIEIMHIDLAAQAEVVADKPYVSSIKFIARDEWRADVEAAFEGAATAAAAAAAVRHRSRAASPNS